MLVVTDDARAFLAGLIVQNDVPEEQSIRLVAGPQGVGLAPDTPSDEDAVFEHEGRAVLVVEEALGERLSSMTLGVQETEQGPSLAITETPEA